MLQLIEDGKSLEHKEFTRVVENIRAKSTQVLRRVAQADLHYRIALQKDCHGRVACTEEEKVFREQLEDDARVLYALQNMLHSQSEVWPAFWTELVGCLLQAGPCQNNTWHPVVQRQNDDDKTSFVGIVLEEKRLLGTATTVSKKVGLPAPTLSSLEKWQKMVMGAVMGAAIGSVTLPEKKTASNKRKRSESNEDVHPRPSKWHLPLCVVRCLSLIVDDMHRLKAGFDVLPTLDALIKTQSPVVHTKTDCGDAVLAWPENALWHPCQ
jgi:hypothetical protein